MFRSYESGMKLIRALFLLPLFLLGCDMPSPYFSGVQAQKVMVSGAEFDVRVRGRLAEALRTNAQYAPRLTGIAPLALHAMQSASGCQVVQITGDAALSLGVLDCGSDRARLALSHVPLGYACDPKISVGRGEKAYEVQIYICNPIIRKHPPLPG